MVTEYLLRRFTGNGDQQTDFKYRYRVSLLAGVVGIACNVLLFAVKFLTGLFIGSISVTADSFNNLSDASSNIISLVGAKLASRPADREHPFGHGRYEYLAALIVAIVIIEVGINILQQSVEKIRHPETTVFSLVALLLLIISVFVKLWMSHFYKTAGQRIDSKILAATSADSRNDVIVTSVTIAVILLQHVLHVDVDGWAGLLVSLFVIWSGFGIAKDTVMPLIGEREDPELADEIRRIVRSEDGIIGVHDLIIHNYGPGKNIAQLHAEVPASMSLEEAHTIIDRAERSVKEALDLQITIHADPVEMNDQETLSAKLHLEEILSAIDGRLTYHDFRLVLGNYHLNLVFDIIVPYEYSEEERRQLLYEIQSRMSNINPRYHCHITCDTAYEG